MPFPIDPKEIQKTEAKLGVTFPLGFKARMSKNNGGELDVDGEFWQLIPFLDPTDRKRLARKCNDIDRETQPARGWRGFPQDAFVIASNGGGDYLILRPSPENPKTRKPWAKPSSNGIMKREWFRLWLRALRRAGRMSAASDFPKIPSCIQALD